MAWLMSVVAVVRIKQARSFTTRYCLVIGVYRINNLSITTIADRTAFFLFK